MSRNITEVRLLNVPLESDLCNTLYFNSVSDQTNYFKSKTKFSEADFSYQRKDRIIRYPRDYDSLLGCNYVMYKNSDYSDKWYYAFITKMEYVSDGMTAIYIETDVIQSWLFDYTLKPSFVEREHVNNDTIGNHTLPENLELGEYIVNDYKKDTNLKPSTLICVGSTVVPSELEKKIGGHYHGIYSGVCYYAYNPV